jgi:hypothetical protein
VRRLVGWISGVLGGITAYRLLRRRPEGIAETAPETVPGDRADELRARLAEARAAEPVADETPAAAAVVEEPEPDPEPEPESPDERRQRVHEEGRAALDDMKSE